MWLYCSCQACQLGMVTVNDLVRNGNAREKSAEISHSISTTAYNSTRTEPLVPFPYPAVLCPTKSKHPSEWHKQFQDLNYLVSLALDKQGTAGICILLPCTCSVPHFIQLT